MAYTSFMRGDNTKMTNTPYTDGLIFLNTEEQALYLDDNNERIPMGGGTGGHIIENNAGTDMAERANLQFGGVYVSDDETNDRTKVNITRNMSKDDFDQLTTAEKLGVIVTSNDPNDYVPFSADMVGYDNTDSGMTATDVQDAIDELNSDIGDLSNLQTTNKSSVVDAINEVVSSGVAVISYYTITMDSGVTGLTGYAIKIGSLVLMHIEGAVSSSVANASVICSGTNFPADLVPRTKTGWVHCGSMCVTTPAQGNDDYIPLAISIGNNRSMSLANDYGGTIYAPRVDIFYSLDV